MACHLEALSITIVWYSYVIMDEHYRRLSIAEYPTEPVSQSWPLTESYWFLCISLVITVEVVEWLCQKNKPTTMYTYIIYTIYV